MFLRFGLKERNCSLRLIPKREQGRSDRNAWSLISALAGGGARSNAVTRIISWREIAAEQPEAREAGE
jgi:hypothetical protein